ncbi:uncharacterized protein LOC144350117, partial [Saccoglossus kowalevskii]
MAATTSSKDTTVTKNERFNDMLVTLNKEIGKDEWITMLQHCSSWIPKATREKKENAYEIFKCLKERNKITIDDTKLLEELLVNIGRKDLVTIVEKYHQETLE